MMPTMFYSPSPKGGRGRTDLGLVKEKNSRLATSLIKALAADFEPEKVVKTIPRHCLK